MPTRYTQIAPDPAAADAGCPDYDCSGQTCQAAIGRVFPCRRQQMRYCATDDYDNCPIYLCKALRSSRTQGLDREALVDSGK
jgi:hypothetical protein